ncbi:MAG: hypothetical protein JEZ00_01960 [Anaerolineaceae bacterium]|nr:hypothetical protein [Anaerolineaceae bacterium]
MKTQFRSSLIGLVLIATLMAAGCQANTTVISTSTPAAPTIAPTKTELAITDTAEPTNTATAKATKTKIATETAVVETTTEETLTKTAVVSPTATPMQLADWSSAEFYTSGSLANWQYFIALQFDGYITGEYYAVVDKNKDYKCEILEMYPNRLYCHGPQAAFMDFVRFEVFDVSSDEIVYQEKIWVPGTYHMEYTD